MLNKEIISTSEQVLANHYKTAVTINSSSGVGGGCINDAHRIETTAGHFFVKYNDANRYPGMFKAEARGLDLLRKSNTVYVPKVVGFGETRRYSLLVLEYIDAASQAADFWENFGAGLAAMHKSVTPGQADQPSSSPPPNNVSTRKERESKTHAFFGLDHDNYIGSLPQSNRQHDNWIDFFVSERLEVQLKRAIDDGRAGRDLAQMFEKL